MWILEWIISLFRKAPPVQRFVRNRASTSAVHTDEELAAYIKSFRHIIHAIDSGDWKKKFFTAIWPVRVTTKFGGWGYVEGRTSGYRINSRLVIVPHDDCMDFTSVCLLIDRSPAMILEERYGRLTVSIINGRDYLDEVLGVGEMDCSNLESFKRLALPVQKVLSDVFAKVHADVQTSAAGKVRQDQEPIEKILHY